MATRWIDFAELKRQVRIRDVLERYGYLAGLEEKKPGKLTGPCPIHGGSGKTAFNVDTDKGIFNCFAECGGGNVLDLVMKIDGVEIREAGEKLADWFGLSFTRSHNGRDRQENSAKVSKKTAGEAPAEHNSQPVGSDANPLLERSLQLRTDHPYLTERKLTAATVSHFGIGYASRGIMRGRIAIPIHNTRGKLVACAGRAVTEELAEEKGKYRLPTNFKKSLELFNLHRTTSTEPLIVVEGFFGAMTLHQAGFENVVALIGSTLSDQQEQLLLEHTDRLVLLFDGDDAGRACERDCYRRLRTQIFLRSVHLSNDEQPDTLTVDRIRELLPI